MKAIYSFYKKTSNIYLKYIFENEFLKELIFKSGIIMPSFQCISTGFIQGDFLYDEEAFDFTNIVDIISFINSLNIKLNLDNGVVLNKLTLGSEIVSIPALINEVYGGLRYIEHLKVYSIYEDKFIMPKKLGILSKIEDFFYKYALFSNDNCFLNNYKNNDFWYLFDNKVQIYFDNTGEIRYISDLDFILNLLDKTSYRFYFDDSCFVDYTCTCLDTFLDSYIKCDVSSNDITSVFSIVRESSFFPYDLKLQKYVSTGGSNLEQFNIIGKFGDYLYTILKLFFMLPDDVIFNLLKLYSYYYLSNRDYDKLIGYIIGKSLYYDDTFNDFGWGYLDTVNYLLNFFSSDHTLLVKFNDFTYIYIYNYNFNESNLFEFINSFNKIYVIIVPDLGYNSNLRMSSYYPFLNKRRNTRLDSNYLAIIPVYFHLIKM